MIRHKFSFLKNNHFKKQTEKKTFKKRKNDELYNPNLNQLRLDVELMILVVHHHLPPNLEIID